MSTEQTPRSRRALLAGAGAGLAAAAAAAVVRPAKILATDGDTVHVGDDLSGTTFTRITNTTAATDAVAIIGRSASGVGLSGTSTAGQGVVGISGSSAGVQGYSDTDAGVNGFGVYGVWATGTNFGVYGTTDAGTGLYGAANSGFALRTSGRTKLSTSGVATIPAGDDRVVVTPGVNIVPGSFVLLTPKANLGTRALWFTTNATANTFTIRMSTSRSSNTPVAWLLLG